MLTKREFERRRERSGRTVLPLLCVSCQVKNFEVLGQLEHFCGAWEPLLLFSWHFFVDLDRDLPEEKFSGVEWCSDAFVSLLEEFKILVFLLLVKIVWRRTSLHPQKTNLTGNRDEARLYFLLSSTFLWCCNFQIFALEWTLSGCPFFDFLCFTPFPVKLISARTGI